MACYVAGVPFFRRALEGDLLYTAVMFGLPVAAAAHGSLDGQIAGARPRLSATGGDLFWRPRIS